MNIDNVYFEKIDLNDDSQRKELEVLIKKTWYEVDYISDASKLDNNWDVYKQLQEKGMCVGMYLYSEEGKDIELLGYNLPYIIPRSN